MYKSLSSDRKKCTLILNKWVPMDISIINCGPNEKLSDFRIRITASCTFVTRLLRYFSPELHNDLSVQLNSNITGVTLEKVGFRTRSWHCKFFISNYRRKLCITSRLKMSKNQKWNDKVFKNVSTTRFLYKKKKPNSFYEEVLL